MQNFSNFLNHIDNKRPCHGFNTINNQHAVVESTTITHIKLHSCTNHNNNDDKILTSDNNLNSTYVNPSSNLTNSNGLYMRFYCFFDSKTRTITKI